MSRRFPNGHGFGPFSLKLLAGTICTLIGSNGCGKSTLIRTTAGLEKPDTGYLSVFGRQVISERVRGDVLGVILQGSEPWPHLNVLDNVKLPLKRKLGMSDAMANNVALEAIERFGLSDRQQAIPQALSGGLRQRVVLARCFALKPKAVLLDEVTSALDPDWAERVRLFLKEFANSGGAVLSVSHRLNFAKRISHWVVYMADGLLVEQGPPGVVLENPVDARLRRLIENA
jgi:polar amino acid transport system ATP-binding protein